MDLRKYFAVQRDFQRLVIPNFDNLTEQEKRQYTKELLLHLISETKEVLDAIGLWKLHSKTGKTQRQQVLEELIDIHKYLIAIATVWGFTPEEFDEEFDRKSAVVWQRWFQEHHLNLSNKKVAAVDLDGVLTEYPDNWIRYLNQQGYKVNVEDYKNRFPNIPRDTYESLKFDFREKGLESLFVEPAPYAQEFAESLKKMGFTIVLLSARPYTRHKRIYGDTIAWLQKHNIPYDYIYFSSDKCFEIAKTCPNLSVMIEDDPEEVERTRLYYSFPVILINKPYNKDYDGKHVYRAADLIEALKIIEEVAK